jgi:alkyl sulfatase BDS1-like metallo-beta-lactamase superfamily hydrolase
VLANARQAYDRGEYRWVCQIVNHVVFADPSNTAARELQAAALEQLGYQSESGPWRNIYLSGALELRHGAPNVSVPRTASPDTVRAMPLDLFFGFLAVRLNGAKAGDVALSLSFDFTDTGEQVAVGLAHGVLSHVVGRGAPDADAQITMTRGALNRLILREATVDDEIASGEIAVQPSLEPLLQLLGLLDEFEFWFHLVEP